MPAHCPELGPCWLWTYHVNADGYAQTRIQGKSVMAHRLSWQLANGSSPADKYVCHKCDNPRCVNPTHLFLGTQQDNMDDMVAKGRYVAPSAAGAGPLNGAAKLTSAEAREIRKLYAAGGLPQEKVAERFGVTTAVVTRIVKRKSYANVCDSCDVLGCSDPTHQLFDLNDNRHRRVRPQGGSDNAAAKLDESTVVEIRKRAASGETQKEIAQSYSVSRSAIGFIVQRITWAHVP